MNLIEAKRNSLVIQAWNENTGELIPEKWILISENKDINRYEANNVYFTTEETQEMIDLLERVNAGSCK